MLPFDRDEEALGHDNTHVKALPPALWHLTTVLILYTLTLPIVRGQLYQ